MPCSSSRDSVSNVHDTLGVLGVTYKGRAPCAAECVEAKRERWRRRGKESPVSVGALVTDCRNHGTTMAFIPLCTIPMFVSVLVLTHTPFNSRVLQGQQICLPPTSIRTSVCLYLGIVYSKPTLDFIHSLSLSDTLLQAKPSIAPPKHIVQTQMTYIP